MKKQPGLPKDLGSLEPKHPSTVEYSRLAAAGLTLCDMVALEAEHTQREEGRPPIDEFTVDQGQIQGPKPSGK